MEFLQAIKAFLRTVYHIIKWSIGIEVAQFVVRQAIKYVRAFFTSLKRYALLH